MPESPLRITLQRRMSPGEPKDRRSRRTVLWLAAVGGLVVIALAAAALIPGSHSTHGQQVGVRSLAAHGSAANPLGVRVTKVVGSNISASNYGTFISKQEQGVNGSGQMTSDLTPIPARWFNRPVAAYRGYAEGWAVKLGNSIPALQSALAAGRRDAAQRAWTTAFSDYLHLGAVYGLLPGDLNDQLAGIPESLGDRHFSGLHRIEMGLWSGASPQSLVPVAHALTGAVANLRQALPHVPITPLDYATRAHEILEDAQRDLMSGTQVPWSKAGVLGTAAGLAVTRKVISTLVPLLQGRDYTLVEVQNWLGRLQQAFNSVKRPDGTWPTLNQLSESQRERLNGTLAGTLGALAGVPGTLETTTVPSIPKLPPTTP
jgi:hypothetical protein